MELTLEPCRLWTGKVNSNGYGVIGAKAAHRAVYEQTYGPIPKGHQVHHTCSTRACVEPRHLVALTVAEHLAIHARPAALESRRRAREARRAEGWKRVREGARRWHATVGESPEKREASRQRMQELNRRLWADPEFRARRTAELRRLARRATA